MSFALRPTFARVGLASLLLVLSSALLLGVGPCDDASASRRVPGRGAGLFLSPQSNPLALSNDGRLLYVANTTSASVSIVDVSKPSHPRVLAEVPVGLDPVGVAVRPGLVNGDELVLVTNHVSDSISVLSRNRRAVVQTLQELDADGVTTTDEPVGVAFAGPSRAFVTLDHPNQVAVLDVAADGAVSLRPERLPVTAQAPRAVTVAGGRVYVAAFESGNQTEFPTCDPRDERGLDESEDSDEGCEFQALVIEDLNLGGGQGQGPLGLGAIFQFAAVNPNIGGRVIRDRDLPDRDLFVYDAASLERIDVVEGIGTLLFGLAATSGGRVFVTHTEARNQLDGLGALDNRMFENRLAMIDCAAGCGEPRVLDLDAGAAALGQTFPTPHGIALSGDGRTLVATAAGADGDPGSRRKAMHGLFTLDAAGRVLGSALVGALPEGVALQSDAKGRARTAYVLNTAESTLSVVDVARPERPRTLVDALRLGDDPTPPQVRLGRIAFHSARGSTNGTFSCGSCHPNGNMDQLLWTINTVVGPEAGPDELGEAAEPRTTMPIRGLRDTLPLHWDGTLADPDPFENPLARFDPAPDCDLEVDGEVGCVRHLVDAALSGPMCQHNGPRGCVPGPDQLGRDGSGLAGALTDTERDAMAAFQLAVLYPPSPRRRPTDRLSDAALGGVSDFFTNEDGLGINNGIGQAVNFAPSTCADNPMGCHSLPLTISTNSAVVGGFDAPSARGMWDRFMLFSNGMFSSEEVLQMAQECADGDFPFPRNAPRIFFVSVDLSNPPDGVPDLIDFPVPISGDPCALQSPVIESPLFGGAPLHPFVDEQKRPIPSAETIWDPEVGMTERGSFVATFEGIFALVYGVRGDRIWEYQLEISVGLPGLTGRQLTLDGAIASDDERLAALAQLEDAAAEGRITASAHSALLGELRFEPASGQWASVPGERGGAGKGKGKSKGKGWGRRGIALTGAELREYARTQDDPVTITAVLPENITIGGADRQPLLDVDPDARAAEKIGDAPSLPHPPQFEPATFRLGARYVDAGAAVLVDGERCTTCSFEFVRLASGVPAIDLTLAPGLPAGVHVMQVLNPDGWASNEMPICVSDGADICDVPGPSIPTPVPDPTT